ncbi:hypothetical protein BCR43DRAFT_491087, partial [Syncephalastrum racemosum]
MGLLGEGQRRERKKKRKKRKRTKKRRRRENQKGCQKLADRMCIITIYSLLHD